jgi:hypothetical protein
MGTVTVTNNFPDEHHERSYTSVSFHTHSQETACRRLPSPYQTAHSLR